jgi:hypothetical protein
MSKYNSPSDYDLIEQIRQLRGRIEQLERFTHVTPAIFTPGVSVADYNAGFVTSSDTFVDAHYFIIYVNGPTPVIRLNAFCSDGTTSGEFRLADSGSNALTGPDGEAVQVGVIPLGTTSSTYFSTSAFSPNYWDDLPAGTDRFLRLQVRRTAGAGSITTRPRHLYQKAS